MTGPHPRLQMYVGAWSDTADRLVSLGGELADDDWERPSDLPGWTVRDLYAHLASIELELVDRAPPPAELPPGLPHVRDAFGAYTERGIRGLADRSPAGLVEAFRGAVAQRAAQLAAEPPSDPEGTPPRTPGDRPWDWETLLRNRVVDLWMHEQDIRRALGRPGALDTPGAAVTVRTFVGALPYVLGKKVAPPPGTTVVWVVTGPQALTAAVRVGTDGRAKALPQVPAEVDARLEMGTEELAVLGGGRRPVDAVPVEVAGDEELARRVLAAMAVTI